jgi:hypothetical protein
VGLGKELALRKIQFQWPQTTRWYRGSGAEPFAQGRERMSGREGSLIASEVKQGDIRHLFDGDSVVPNRLRALQDLTE